MVFLTGYAQAENATCTWKGVSGRWSEKSNWTGNAVPDETDIASFPKGTYTITVDEAVSCLFLRTESGSGSGTITISGGGSLTCTGQVDGPSVNSYAKSDLSFANITVSMKRFNPYGGTLRVKNGADFRVTNLLYVNSGSSMIVVDGGKMTVTGNIDVRSAVSLVVKDGELNTSSGNLSTGNASGTPKIEIFVSGGIYRNASWSPAAAHPITTVQQTGGVLQMRSALPSAVTTVNIADGTFVMNGVSFNAATHAAWMPKKGKLVLNNDSYTALTLGSGTTMTIPDDTTVYITNNVAGHGITETAYPGIYANTNTAFVGNGELYANYMFIRGACTVDVSRVCFGTKIHNANSDSSLWVPNGQTFGAYGDWSSVYNNAASYFYGPITVDTSDCFDGVTPRNISFGRVFADRNVDYVVTGSGTNELEIGELRSWMHSLTVENGATFRFLRYRTKAGTMQLGYFTMSHLSLGDGSTFMMTAGQGVINAAAAEISPTARIVVEVPSALTAGKLYQLMTMGDGHDYSSQVSLTGEWAGAWNLVFAAGTLYLSDGNQTVTYPSTDSNVTNDWTGAVDGWFSNAGNWHLGSAPTSSAQTSWLDPDATCLQFPGGTAQTVVTNDIADTDFGNDEKGLSVCWMQFLSSAGPYEIHGNMIQVCSQGYSSTAASIYSDTPFPVVFYAPLYRSSGKFGIVTHGNGYIQFMGEVRSSNADYYGCGDIRFGGDARFKGVYFTSPNNTAVRLTVLDGGKFYANGNDALLKTSGYPYTFINVCDGGEFTYDGTWEPGNLSCTYVVDGRFAVSNRLVSLKTAPFSGAGTVYLGGVVPSTSAAQATFEGDVTLEMGGDWNPVTTQNPNTPFTPAVLSGGLTLRAVKDWAYGLPDGVTTVSDCGERAIKIAKNSTLTLGASDFTTTFRDSIVGEGSLVFAPGARVALGGELLRAANPKSGGWATLATVGAVSGEPAVPENYVVKTVNNGDGTISVQIRIKPGMVFVFR